MKKWLKNKYFIVGVGVALPTALSGLFYALRGNRGVMDGWVDYVLTPIAQLFGRFWGIFPFSVAELIIVAAVIGVPYLLIRGIYFTVRSGRLRPLTTSGCILLVGGLWVFAALNWMWNVTYYATGFAEESGLDTSPYSAQELFDTTVYFAQQAAIYSTQVERTDTLHIIVDQETCFEDAVYIYDNLEQEFEFLAMYDVGAKPLIFSHTQSMLGFTGIYFPFTGEANVNVDAPRCILPVVIAHEMAHQRLIASEDEANFLGIAACVTSDNTTYQYSGYLFGLMQLSNALYSVSPEAWEAIWNAYATEELYTDWMDHYEYWDNLESDIDESATEIYDSYLKSNDQALGMLSYDACVDLLVAYFNP